MICKRFINGDKCIKFSSLLLIRSTKDIEYKIHFLSSYQYKTLEDILSLKKQVH